MMFTKKNKEDKKPAAAKGQPDAQPGDVKVSVKPMNKPDKVIWRTFPGPKGAQAGLRVAVDRDANANLVAHARELLDVEVCGVLVGQVCEDDEGLFVHVETIIRGTAASQASTHVTFTQATWNAIHETLERDHPKQRIVGWYHTHPGFGVEFSEMDLFIQRNFFPGPTQIALVTDPVSGAVAICVNTARDIEYLPRYWVEGREQQCRVPEKLPSPAATMGGEVTPAGNTAALQALESRVNQLVQLVEEQRAAYDRFLLFVGMTVCVGIIVATGYSIYSNITSRLEPPKVNQVIPIPIQVGDKTVLMGVAVTSWEVPEEYDAILLRTAKLKLEMEAKAAKQAGKTGTNEPAPAPK